MPLYHHLIFDPSDHVESVQSREAANDDEAIVQATRLLPSIGHILAVEVWRGSQRVQRLEISGSA
jgi:hypothetical protein